MPVRPIVFQPNHTYYLFNQGNRKQKVFLERADYDTFLELLERYLKRYKVSLLSYRLLPHQLHFLAQQKSAIPLSKFMGVLCLSFSIYINHKYNLVGSLFQGRFKAHPIEDEELLLLLSKYLHTKTKRPRNSFSSLTEYLEPGKHLTETRTIHGIFSSLYPSDNYKDFVRRKFTKAEWDYLRPFLFT